MTFFFFLLYAVFAIALQKTWAFAFPAQMVSFDFLLPLVAAIAFEYEWRRGVPLLLFLGVMVDAASVAPFGLTAASFALVYGLFRIIMAHISFHLGVGRFFWIAAISVTEKIIASGLMFIATGSGAWGMQTMSRAPLQGLFDGAVGFMLTPLLIAWSQKRHWPFMRQTRPLL